MKRINDDQEVEVLVVEDDPNDAELITRALRKNNLANRLVHLKDGAEAVDFLLGQEEAPIDRPRVILLDLKLPKLNGIEVLRRLKADERTKTIPVVILTSSQEDRDLSEAYSLGVNSYVTKPINFDEFVKAVSELGMYWMILNKSNDH